MKKLLSLTSAPINLDLGLLLFRLIFGVLMAFYGYDKLIHFNEMAASEFWANKVNFLGMTGVVPLALTVFAEFFCSLLLIFGLFTRQASFILAFCMAYIFLVVFPGSMIENNDNGISFSDPFLYFVCYMGLFFTGAGKYSLDLKLFTKAS